MACASSNGRSQFACNSRAISAPASGDVARAAIWPPDQHCVAMDTNLPSQIASQNIVFGCKSQFLPMQSRLPTAQVTCSAIVMQFADVCLAELRESLH